MKGWTMPDQSERVGFRAQLTLDHDIFAALWPRDQRSAAICIYGAYLVSAAAEK